MRATVQGESEKLKICIFDRYTSEIEKCIYRYISKILIALPATYKTGFDLFVRGI